MLLTSLIIAPLFTAGFAVMLKELIKAPVGYQDEQGFHKMSDGRKVAMDRTKRKRARRQTVEHSFAGFQAAHAR